MRKKEKEIIKKELKRIIRRLDNCWGHHQDGSDLLIDEHKLFDIVFNDVIKGLEEITKMTDKKYKTKLEKENEDRKERYEFIING